MAEDAGRTDNQPQSERAEPPPSATDTELSQEAAAAMRRGLDAAAAGNYDAAEEAFAEAVVGRASQRHRALQPRAGATTARR